MIHDERDESGLEDLGGGAHTLREQGIDPGVHTAIGTATSIRMVLQILTLEERKAFFVVLAAEIELMIKREDWISGTTVQ